MTSHSSPRDIQKRATDILNRCAPVKESLQALIDLATTFAGYNPCPALGEVDLERDVSDLAEQVQFVFRELPPPAEMNYLLVNSARWFDSVVPGSSTLPPPPGGGKIDLG